MSGLLALLQKHRQFLLYCLCGGSGVLSHSALYYLLIHSGTEYKLANAIGYLAGTLLSFALNRVFTFNMRDQTGKRLVLFLTTAAIGFAASHSLLWLLVEIFHINQYIALIPTIPTVVVLQFGLNKRFAFQAAKTHG